MQFTTSLFLFVHASVVQMSRRTSFHCSLFYALEITLINKDDIQRNYQKLGQVIIVTYGNVNDIGCNNQV